jgi:hypothetical protein
MSGNLAARLFKPNLLFEKGWTRWERIQNAQIKIYGGKCRKFWGTFN